MSLRKSERFKEHLRHHHWRPLSPVGRYARRSLRRRIFFWFISGMIGTAFTVALAGFLLSRTVENPWAMNAHRIEAWVGDQFARDFNDAPARDAFLKSTADQLNADIALVTPSGAPIAAVGDCTHHAFMAPIVRNGTLLANAMICPRSSGGRGWIFFGAAAIFLMMVWKVSGRIANRLSRPVDELTRVVKRLGEGDLSARADLGCIDANEIGMVALAVNDMASRIEKQLNDQRELLATVSHELRTPLARMRLISEIARDTQATTKTYDDLDREVAEVDALVGQLLASSRVEFGPLQRHSLSAKDLGIRALERAGLDPTLLSVEGNIDAIDGDATLIQRALANLIDNARKHANGVDGLRISVTPEKALFEVTDSGPGVPAKADSIFETFQRGNGSEGLGLGLALVKRIAVAHGGTVWARNRDTKGAVIGFDVQLTKAAA